MAGWTSMPNNPGAVDQDNNSGGYDGTIPQGSLGHKNTDMDNGYGPGPEYPDSGLGATGQLGHLNNTDDGYSGTLQDGKAFQGPLG